MAIGRPLSLSTNIATHTTSVEATLNQTVFTISGGYRINELSVYRNGVRLVDARDYTARDGTTVTLLSPAAAGDTLEFHTFDSFNVADTLSGHGDQSINGSLSASGGFNIGIQSGGTNITTGIVTALNFIGAGNTFVYNSGTKTVDLSIESVNITGTSAGLSGTPDITIGTLNATSGTAAAPSVSVGTTDNGLYSPGTDKVALATNGTGRLFIDSSGNVGVGTSIPTAKLDVNGNQTSNIVAMAALDVDCSAGNYFTKTINGNSTFTFSNVPSNRSFSFVLELTHTSGTVTWPASVKFPADTAPTLTTGKTHLFVFETNDGGTRFRGASLVDYVN